MERWCNRIAVVTGASAGIGAAVAKELVEAGLIVVGLARRKNMMEELRSTLTPNLQTRFHAIQCDVSKKESVDKAFDWIEENLGGVDVLINNAGVMKTDQILTMDIGLVEQTLSVNVLGMVYCSRRAFASMQARHVDGHVVLINSIVGHHIFNPAPGRKPTLNIYPSSKHATVALTEILRQEFRDLQTKIKVTSISPGAVATEMLGTYYKDLPKLSAEDVSSAVMYCLSTPPHVQVHELTIKPLGEMF